MDAIEIIEQKLSEHPVLHEVNAEVQRLLRAGEAAEIQFGITLGNSNAEYRHNRGLRNTRTLKDPHGCLEPIERCDFCDLLETLVHVVRDGLALRDKDTGYCTFRFERGKPPKVWF